MSEPNLSAILEGLFGRSWRRLAPRAMGCGDRHLMRVRAGTRGLSGRLLRELQRAALRLPARLEEWRVEEHARVDAEADRRRLEMAGALTQMKLLLIDEERNSGLARRPRSRRRQR